VVTIAPTVRKSWLYKHQKRPFLLRSGRKKAPKHKCYNVKDPSPSRGWACRAVPACHRETCEGNFETSLAKFRKGRMKATEPTGRRAVQARCGRLPNLHPLCWSVAKGTWGAQAPCYPARGLNGQVWPFLLKTASRKGDARLCMPFFPSPPEGGGYPERSFYDNIHSNLFCRRESSICLNSLTLNQ